MFSRFCPAGTRRVAICRGCGHVQVFPMFSAAELERINARFFGTKYLQEGREAAHNAGKQAALDERLGAHLRPGLSVLDVGAGEGWGARYFAGKGCAYHAIEAVDRLAENVRAQGGTVIGGSLYADLPDWAGRFDLVVFRHVLEHLLRPAEAFQRLARLLRPDGLLYAALPNARQPAAAAGFRTSYLRPVHVSYFCAENVLRLAAGAGLRCRDSGADSELYFILGPGSEEGPSLGNQYADMKRVFREHSARHRLRDAANLCRILAGMLLR
jgi:2-polyprenyl-3-methyl-5-hydroxy-6-metoxy-1,4-benzoquinol methylase